MVRVPEVLVADDACLSTALAAIATHHAARLR